MTNAMRWPPIRELFNSNEEQAAIDAVFPEAQRMSFFAGLEQIDTQRIDLIRQAGRRIEVASQLADFPILAVAGMLNSGKTSLVATWLSDSGRRRSLRGESNSAGTHRFVLWLPECWRNDPEVWSLLMTRLAEALGEPPEMLSADPQTAHRQYNNAAGDAGALSIPLVATDSRLDEVSVGLLDCPDIVTGDAFGRGALEVRTALLRRAASLCSAFVIVTDFGSLRAGTVGNLLDIAAETMPDVQRLLAINKIRPKYLPHQVKEDLQPVLETYGISGSYLAYDYEIPGSEQFMPDSADRGSRDDPMPVFFETPASPIVPIHKFEYSQLLAALPRRLNRSQLFEDFRRSQEAALSQCVWIDGVDFLRDHFESQADTAVRARGALRDASLEFFARRDFATGRITELRLHQSDKIIGQLTDAFVQTAPWWARMGMKMNRWFSGITRSATDFVSRLNISGSAREKAIEVRDKFRRGVQGSVLSGERLCDAYRRHDVTGQMRREIDDDSLLQRCSTIVDRFNEEDRTLLDGHQLRETASQMWRELSMKKKLQHGLTPVAALFASFSAVLMVPIDAGGSLLLHASIAELLLATGLTGLVTAWNSQDSLRVMERQAAQQQLADFIAIQCDALGVPRSIDDKSEPLLVEIDGQTYRVPSPKVRSCPTSGEVIRIWAIRQEFTETLHRLLPRE